MLMTNALLRSAARCTSRLVSECSVVAVSASPVKSSGSESFRVSEPISRMFIGARFVSGSEVATVSGRLPSPEVMSTPVMLPSRRT